MRVIGQTLSLMPAFVKIWLPLAVLLHHLPYVDTELDEIEQVEDYGGLQNEDCLGPNRACVVWQDDPNKTIKANDEDFLLYSSKVAYINGTYELVNSTNRYLPVTHSLMGITGSVVITGNDNLEYLDELNALVSVEGPSIIRDNKRLKIPVSLFKVLCSHEDSICEVEVYCKGDFYIIAGFPTTLHPRCNIIHGSLVVSGHKDDKHTTAILSNLHTVFGTVRIINNNVKNFAFLKKLSKIEYNGKAGCAIEIAANMGFQRFGLLNLKNVKLISNNSKKFCILKNRRKESNEYYHFSQDKTDKRIFIKLNANASLKADNPKHRPIVQYSAEPYFDATNSLLIGFTVLFVALTIVIAIFWTSDYKCRACFYKYVPRVPKLSKRKEKKAEISESKSCYVGLVNGASVEGGGGGGYLKEYDFSQGAIYATGPKNNNESAADNYRSCYMAGQAVKKRDAMPESVFVSAK